MKKLAGLVCITIVLLSGTAFAQAGVANDSPSWINIDVEHADDIVFVHLAIKDLNGWDDIYMIQVNVTDNYDYPLSQVIFRLYQDITSTTLLIEWEEIVGSHLVREQSSWMAVDVYPWTTPDVSLKEVGLNVTFAFNAFSGDKISVTALDKGLASCEYVGPFPEISDQKGISGFPLFWVLVIVVILLIVVIIIVGVWAVTRTVNKGMNAQHRPDEAVDETYVDGGHTYMQPPKPPPRH